MIYFIEFLRAIATALIANSHFKGVYPNDIFSFGGGYGLALFFMISGYLLVNINGETRFFPWIWKKLPRLYIPLYLVRVVELVIGNTVIAGIKDLIIYFIFPGSWFGGALIIMYCLYFVLVKYCLKGKPDNKSLIIVSVAMLCYVLLFGTKLNIAQFSLQTMQIESKFGVETPYLISQFVWLSCMMMGYWLRVRKPELKRKVLLYCLFILAIVLFVVVKLINRNGEHLNAELILGPAYVCFSTSIFMIFQGTEQWCRETHKSIFGKLVSIVSTCSLEIYYIQFIWIRLLKNIIFPINLLLLIIVIVSSGYLVHLLSTLIINKLMKMEKSR